MIEGESQILAANVKGVSLGKAVCVFRNGAIQFGVIEYWLHSYCDFRFCLFGCCVEKT